jgi:hypothetical protein
MFLHMGVSLSLQRAGNRFHEAVEREGILPIARLPDQEDASSRGDDLVVAVSTDSSMSQDRQGTRTAGVRNFEDVRRQPFPGIWPAKACELGRRVTGPASDRLPAACPPEPAR